MNEIYTVKNAEELLNGISLCVNFDMVEENCKDYELTIDGYTYKITKEKLLELLRGEVKNDK